MKNLIKKIASDKLAKRVMTLFTGSALGAIIYFVFQPLITRIYTPSELGMYAFVFSIASMFSSVVNGHYDLTIVSAKNDKEADKLAVLSFIFSIILIMLVGIVLIIILILFPEKLQNVGWWSLTACLFLLIFSINNILASYNNRYLQYKILSKVSVYKNSARVLFQIIFGLLKMGFIGILSGNLLGYLIGVRQQASFINGDYSRFTKYRLSDIWKVAKKYYKQPIFSAPGLFFVAASNSIISLYIGILYGAEALGYYFLSVNILNVPISLISTNMGKVFFQSANEEKSKTGTFNKTLKKTTIILVLISVPSFILLYLIAEPLFSFIFGESWSMAGYLVSIQTPMYAVRFIVTSVMFGFILTGKQLQKLVLQMGFLLCSLLAAFISQKMNLQINQFIMIINVLFLFNYILMYLFIFKASIKNTK